MSCYVSRVFFGGIRLSINDPNHVTVKRERLGGSFEMLGTDIVLALRIGPLQRRGDQLHQMVHEHTTAFLWIE